jgi:hypothetical protein
VQLAVSPYHLSTCDAAALAAILLADRVVTMLPVPTAGIDAESVAAAMRASPEYARLLDSWRWASPLFRAGVVTSLAGDEDAIADAAATRERIGVEPAWQPLRPFMHAGDLVGEEYLDRVSSDMLKGGPDPGWSLPIIAGLDALARRHGMMAVRAGGGQPGAPLRRSGAWRGSAAQVAEWRLGKQLLAAAIPVLTQASAKTLLLARAELEPQLRDLRATIGAAAASDTSCSPAAIGRVRQAAGVYSTAFEGFIAGRGGPGRDDAAGRQALHGFMRVTVLRLPADAALLAARVASGQLQSGRAGTPPPSAGLRSVSEQSQRPLTALVIEPMSGQPMARTEART